MEHLAFGAAIALLIAGGLLVLALLAVVSLHLASGSIQVAGVRQLTVSGSIAASAGAGLFSIVRLLLMTGLLLRNREQNLPPAAVGDQQSSGRWRRHSRP